MGSRKSLRECKLFETRNFLATTSKNTYIVDIFDHSKLVNVRLNNIVITYHRVIFKSIASAFPNYKILAGMF